MSFREAAFELWVKTCVHECAELQEAKGKELHGSSARTVLEACKPFLPHTGQLHGPCKRGNSSARVLARTVSVVWLARVFSTGRVREACALIFRVARGMLSSTRGVSFGQHGSWLALHGACFSGSHGACKSSRVTHFTRVTFASARVMQFFFF